MASTAKTAVTQISKSNITPTRTFFRVSQNISSIAHARAIFKSLGGYGDMVEYKFMRCPETRKYLRHGFVVYKHNDSAKKALSDEFVKVQSELFDKPVEVKIEKSLHQQHSRK